IKTEAGDIAAQKQNAIGENIVFHGKPGRYTIHLSLNKDHFFDFKPRAMLLDRDREYSYQLQRKYKINGYVYDTKHHPVLNAHVKLASATGTLERQTDTNGYFTFFPVRLAEYTLSISHPDYQTQKRTFRPPRGAFKIILSGHPFFAVHTVDAATHPLSGIEVQCVGQLEAGGMHSANKQTNIKGIAYFDIVHNGTFTLTAKAPFPIEPLEVKHYLRAGETHDVTLEIHRKTFSLYGKVLDEGSKEAVAGVTVACQPKSDTLGGNQTCVTSANGAFQFENLYHGTYTLFVEQTEGFITGDFSDHSRDGVKAPQQLAYYVDKDIHNIILYLKRSWQVYGKVIDEIKNPVEGAKVQPSHRFSVPLTRYSARKILEPVYTDSAGEFFLEGLFEDIGGLAKLGLNASHGDYAPCATNSVEIDIPKPGEIKRGVVIQLTSKYNFRGTVVNQVNEPVENALIYVLARNQVLGKWKKITTARSQNDGTFQTYVDTEKYATVKCYAIATGHEKSETKTVKLKPHITEVHFTLQESENNSIIGCVYDQDLQPVVDADIHVELYGKGTHVNSKYDLPDGKKITQTDEYGVFQIQQNIYKFIIYMQFFDDPVLKITAKKEVNDTLLKGTIYDIQQGDKGVVIIIESEIKNIVELYGQVMHENKPVNQFKLLIAQGSTSQYNPENQNAAWQYFETADGRFHLAQIPIIRQPLIVVAQNDELGIGYSEPIHIDPLTVKTDVQITIPPRIPLRGVVLNEATGEPVGNMEVWYSAVTDADKENQKYGGRVLRSRGQTGIDQLFQFQKSVLTTEQGQFEMLVPQKPIWLHTKMSQRYRGEARFHFFSRRIHPLQFKNQPIQIKLPPR
ncbi:hypothetical protein GF373_15495, partial [bacterium]|nr:hypothetical protein [bacterium]